MKKNKRICLVAVFPLILFACGPMEDRSSDAVKMELVRLDSVVRYERFNLDNIENILTAVQLNLPNKKDRTFSNGMWATKATFRFDHDSTVVMIIAKKVSSRGFKNEVILNLNDTALFVRRFEVLTDDPAVGYELLETVDYVTKTQNLLNRVRHEFPMSLSDSVAFRMLELRPYESEIGEHYDTELDYARRIMNWN